MPRPIFHKTVLMDVTYIPLLNSLLNESHISFAVIFFNIDAKLISPVTGSPPFLLGRSTLSLLKLHEYSKICCKKSSHQLLLLRLCKFTDINISLSH